MTDKQIIIDGIDVGGCIYYEDGKCLNGEMVQCNCKKVAVCYYKEYKRKEQECKELKEEIKKHNDDMFKNPPEKRFYCKGCTLPYISKKLKTENDNLKETFDDLFKVQYKLADTNKKLRQCLTEIKEIAEICKCHNADGCYECKYFDDCEVEDEEIPTRDVCKLILQKISECEVK